MLIDADRTAGLVFLAPGQEGFEIFLEILGFCIVDRDDDGEQRLDPPDPQFLGLPLQILFHVIQGHDPDDVALPDVSQVLGAHEAVECLVPGNLLKIDRRFPFDLVFDEDVQIGDPGEGAQDGLDIRLAHLQADRLRREPFGVGYRLLFRGRFVPFEHLLGDPESALPRRGRMARRRFRHCGPFLEEGVLLDGLLLAGAAEDQHAGQQDGRQASPRTAAGTAPLT